MYESGRVPALRWPLEIGPDGKLATVSSMSEGWAQRVKSVVSTRPRDRVMRSTYGCAVPDNLFTPVPTDSPERLIRQAIGTWIPQVEVQEVVVQHASSDVDIEVHYRIPGGDMQQMKAAFGTPAGEGR